MVEASGNPAVLAHKAPRYWPQNIVAAGLRTQLHLQLSYAIGVAKPVSLEPDRSKARHGRVCKTWWPILSRVIMTPQGIINTS